LSSNQIGNAGAAAIGEGLRFVNVHACFAFRHLTVASPLFDFCHTILMSPRHRLDSGKMTPDSAVIWVVSVLWCNCGVFDILDFVHRHCSSLQALELDSNKFGDAGAVAIGEGLRCVNVHAGLTVCRVIVDQSFNWVFSGVSAGTTRPSRHWPCTATKSAMQVLPQSGRD
jgi:hypothetical protein